MRGQGRIFLRGQYHWIAYSHRGREHREPGCEGCGSAELGKCREAERRLRARLREIHGDRFVGPQQERVTLAALLRAYRTHRELAGMKSPIQAQSQLRRVEAFFGELRAGDLTAAQLEAWTQARLADGYAPATVRQWLALLRAEIGRAHV